MLCFHGGVLKKLRERLSTPVAQIDAQNLRAFCGGRTGCTPIGDVRARERMRVVGEISSMRIVPRDGSPWLEATVTDGTGSMLVMWTGRRRIAGISPGKRLVLEGRAAVSSSNSRLTLYNPVYELL